MKKTRLCVLCISLIVSLLSFNSCSDDSSEVSDLIVDITGSWQMISEDYVLRDSKAVVQFSPDGRLVFDTYKDQTGLGIYVFEDQETSSWTREGNHIKIKGFAPMMNDFTILKKDANSFVGRNVISESEFVRYATPEHISIVGCWKLSDLTGTITQSDGTVIEATKGGWIYKNIYFSNESILGHPEFNGAMGNHFGCLFKYTKQNDQIVIDKLSEGKWNFKIVVKDLSLDKVIFHLEGYESTESSDFLNFDLTYLRVPTFGNL